ncbi:sll0787 family AIR synthase-like protein [Spirosoma endbachense]|uniref:Sll0787 family AIR synthase-like protein n=1 Tax=Spirosoma endbachense TaxID=2666025 RepID=A0A6P1VXE1_9BACT|nr:sll0787 family AIR synthase-like protein [Spirosoma endbachense]QHV97783.1 sll0787 family AIR synthase-like protein [Spirosoma endbachense]
MLQNILAYVLAQRSVSDKLTIDQTYSTLGDYVTYQDPFDQQSHQIFLGDDCAVIPDGHGDHLLFSSEGIITSFLEAAPWFAGYSSIMVNISDICSMGGLPMAVTDVIWMKDQEQGTLIWEGMMAASAAYGVPIVGGHTCYHTESRHLAVSILGKAKKLLESKGARQSETLLMAVDMDGSYYQNYPFWNASTTANPIHLRANLSLMYELANRGLSAAAKDISMGGIIGTLAMFVKASGVGAELYLEQIPRPDGVDWEKWLISFPSFGYLFTCKPGTENACIDLFTSHHIQCKAIGTITGNQNIVVYLDKEKSLINLIQ